MTESLSIFSLSQFKTTGHFYNDPDNKGSLIFRNIVPHTYPQKGDFQWKTRASEPC